MNILDTFGQFYNSLDIVGLVVFWLIFFAFLVLLASSINLYKKNKQLVFIIDDLRKKINDTVKTEKEKTITEQNEQVNVEKVKEEKIVDNPEKVETKVVESIKKEEGPYSKNVLRENSARYQTSPISIKKSENKDKVNILSVSKDEIPPVPEEKMSFAEKISKKMEEELKPQTIELTDYEKKQEEEAIISYQELLNTNKDRLYQITDDEETVDFIKELKSFRSSL